MLAISWGSQFFMGLSTRSLHVGWFGLHPNMVVGSLGWVLKEREEREKGERSGSCILFMT